MTDFEQTKAELHKLVDGLDEEKHKHSNLKIGTNLGIAVTSFSNVIQALMEMQKEPTLEEKLQELGFVVNKGETKDNELYYTSYDQFQLGICHIDTIDTAIRISSTENKNKILKCAKFLKELRNEDDNNN